MNLRRFSGFLVAGGTATVCNYSLFAVLLLLGAHYLVAAAIGYLAGIGVSYAINRRWVFRRAASVRGRVGKYVAAYFAALVVQLSLLEALVQAGMMALIANGLALLVVVVANFWVISRFVFPAERGKDSVTGL